MARPSKHIIPPSLERQLQHIELIGNAEAELAAQEDDDPFFTEKAVNSNVSISEQQHRLDTARDQFLRETARTRKFGFFLLGLIPVTCLTYIASIVLENPMLALASTLLTGLIIGFGVVVILMSNRNLKNISEAEK